MHDRFDPIAELQSVGVAYKTKNALRDCNLIIERGESVAFLGPNGAGKTTLLEVIAGFRSPSTGAVRVFGKDPVTFNSADVGRLGIILQSWRDHSMWRVGDLIDLVQYAHGQLDRVDRAAVKELIDVLGIQKLMNNKLMKLSGGERRRVDTCLALLSKPEVLILDEPTTAFDPNVRRSFHRLMRELRGADTTLLWATHDLHEAEQNCDRIILLSNGRIVRDATPAKLRSEVEGGVCIEYQDRDGRALTESVSNPDERLIELVSLGARDIRVSATSFEDVYLNLLDGMEAQDVAVR